MGGRGGERKCWEEDGQEVLGHADQKRRKPERTSRLKHDRSKGSPKMSNRKKRRGETNWGVGGDLLTKSEGGARI